MVTPRRGDVFLVDFDPVLGSEQAGRRPAVVVQNDIGNRYSPTTIVAAVTTKLTDRPYPFLVTLPEDVLQRPSAVDCAQLRTVDAARISTGRLAHLDGDTMCAVDEALKASLGLR